ncbi:hypothetical protein LIER_05553 [Lithospermum erythrorhizon]|uniref:RNase H type-1 domain-containing protein n=1 Tax=Lithospermum erythrorhizon TaxID=34254 RepID=A0AAV3P5U3_LITER
MEEARPRTSIKAQALADFVVECTHGPAKKVPELVNLVENTEQRVWLLYVDGASNPGGSGAGILLWSQEGHKIEYALQFTFTATNNESKYEAHDNGLSLANALGAEHIHIRTDSQLLVDHVKGNFKDPEAKLEVYPAGWDRLSKVFLGLVAEMRHPGRRDDGFRRNAFGRVWKPH